MMPAPPTASGRVLPVRCTICPATAALTTTPPIIGMVTMPEAVADAPCAPCRKSGMNCALPIIATEVTAVIRIVTA